MELCLSCDNTAEYRVDVSKLANGIDLIVPCCSEKCIDDIFRSIGDEYDEPMLDEDYDNSDDREYYEERFNKLEKRPEPFLSEPFNMNAVLIDIISCDELTAVFMPHGGDPVRIKFSNYGEKYPAVVKDKLDQETCKKLLNEFLAVIETEDRQDMKHPIAEIVVRGSKDGVLEADVFVPFNTSDGKIKVNLHDAVIYSWLNMLYDKAKYLKDLDQQRVVLEANLIGPKKGGGRGKGRRGSTRKRKTKRKSSGGKRWIQKAIKNKGALRRRATRMGLLRGKNDKLSRSDLAKLAKAARKTKTLKDDRQVALARTLRGMRH